MQTQLTIELTTEVLRNLWQRVLGDSPVLEQFEVWATLHSPGAMKHGIMKTAIKNIQMGGQMSQDHKVRFASKVMQTRTIDPQKARTFSLIPFSPLSPLDSKWRQHDARHV
jgi:hypothetical protein